MESCTVNEKRQNPMVSILCVTYNHVSYIRDAIEGFLMQKTNFLYEIIIHDDASTDGTVEILKEYEAKYPNLIRVIFEKENQYSKGNLIKLIYELEKQESRGKYIAVCEGDDCWFDSQKLQVQVDYLESHPECILSIHNAIWLDCRNNHIEIMNKCNMEEDWRAKEIIVHEKGYIATASMVYRNEMLNMEDFFLKAGVGDYVRQLYCLAKGKVHYFNRVMSVYRYSHKGSWQEEQAQDFKKHFVHCMKLISFLELYDDYTNGKYGKYIISAKQTFLESMVCGIPEEQIKKYLSVEEEFADYSMAIKRYLRQRLDKDFCDKKVTDFVKEYKHIVIMGTGVFGNILSGQLENNNIDYEGFIVSDNQKKFDRVCDKKVWYIKDMPFPKSDTGILVGINPTMWYEIKDILENAALRNYICPFILEKS